MQNLISETPHLHRFAEALSLWYKCQRVGKSWGNSDPVQWLTREARNFTINFMSMSRAEQNSYLTSLQALYSTLSFLEDESDTKKELDKLFYGEQPDLVFNF